MRVLCLLTIQDIPHIFQWITGQFYNNEIVSVIFLFNLFLEPKKIVFVFRSVSSEFI